MREAMYRAYVTRASELGPQYGNGKPEWDNTAVLADQLKLRAEEAHMLGYNNFAEVSLAPKMAESPAQVMSFLEDLATRARPHAEQDWKELREFAANELGMSELQPWDMTFAAETSASEALFVLRERGQTVLPGRRRVQGSVQGHRNAVRRAYPARRSGRLASGRALFPRRESGRRASSRSSTSICTRAKANAAAPGWTTRAAVTSTRTAACKRRSRI